MRSSFLPLHLQAERSQTHPMEYAQQLRQSLVNVPNGAQLFTVKGNHLVYMSLEERTLTLSIMPCSNARLS